MSGYKLAQVTLERAFIIDDFWRRDWSDYSLPDNRSSIVEAVVEAGNDVIAYGQVKHFAELMLFTNMEKTPKERVIALKMLMAEAFRGCEKAGLKECYCLIKDMRFARLIAKHFDFHLIDNPGVLLHKEL